MIAASAQRHASVTCRQRAVASRGLCCLLIGYMCTCSPPVVLSARMLPLSGQHCLTAVLGMPVSLRVARVPVHLVGGCRATLSAFKAPTSGCARARRVQTLCKRLSETGRWTWQTCLTGTWWTCLASVYGW